MQVYEKNSVNNVLTDISLSDDAQVHNVYDQRFFLNAILTKKFMNLVWRKCFLQIIDYELFEFQYNQKFVRKLQNYKF